MIFRRRQMLYVPKCKTQQHRDPHPYWKGTLFPSRSNVRNHRLLLCRFLPLRRMQVRHVSRASLLRPLLLCRTTVTHKQSGGFESVVATAKAWESIGSVVIAQPNDPTINLTIQQREDQFELLAFWATMSNNNNNAMTTNEIEIMDRKPAAKSPSSSGGDDDDDANEGCHPTRVSHLHFFRFGVCST
jgi:hypothetical protein